MDTPTRQQVLESCPVAAETVWARHGNGFADAFVIPAKRERWRELLIRRPRQISRNSHKLHSDLDRRVCRIVAESAVAGLRGEGVFYDFGDAPRVLEASFATLAAGGRDAIFSLTPGKLALYFFHEEEVWLCQSD